MWYTCYWKEVSKFFKSNEQNGVFLPLCCAAEVVCYALPELGPAKQGSTCDSLDRSRISLIKMSYKRWSIQLSKMKSERESGRFLNRFLPVLITNGKMTGPQIFNRTYGMFTQFQEMVRSLSDLPYRFSSSISVSLSQSSLSVVD